MVGCTVWNWDVGVDMVLDAIVNDNWETFRDEHHQVPLSLEDGCLDIPVWGNMVPQDVQEYAETLKQQIIDGTVEIPDIDEW